LKPGSSSRRRRRAGEALLIGGPLGTADDDVETAWAGAMRFLLGLGVEGPRYDA
jgi:hypothetical protein